jgi:hypothetical protein
MNEAVSACGGIKISGGMLSRDLRPGSDVLGHAPRSLELCK